MKRFCAAILLFAFGLIAGVMVERLLLHAPVITGRAVASKVQPSQTDAAISHIPQESAFRTASHSPELSLAEIEIGLRRCVAMPDFVRASAEAIQLAGAVRSTDMLVGLGATVVRRKR